MQLPEKKRKKRLINSIMFRLNSALILRLATLKCKLEVFKIASSF